MNPFDLILYSKVGIIILVVGFIIYFIFFKKHNKCWGITKNLKICKKPTGGKLLCLQHKNKLILYLITIISSIVITFLPEFSKLSVNKNILITPEKVTLFNNGWSITTPITVSYAGNKPLFSVWIKISIVGQINIDSISLTFPEFKMIPEVQFSKLIVANKVFVIGGSDPFNKDAIYLCLDKMHQN